MTPRAVSVVLFDEFESLDVFGPVELLGMLPDEFALSFVGPDAGPVASRQRARVVADRAYRDADPADLILVPGGMGTRRLVEDAAFLGWLREYGSACPLVTSVCTGSAVLAAAGLLEGYRATSNKAAFEWVTRHGGDVTWVPHARWVEDRDRWTSSGVAAGMDMTAALIRSLCGADTAKLVTDLVELETRDDPSLDPFAALYGL